MKKKFLIGFIILVFVGIITLFGVNCFVVNYSDDRIIDYDDAIRLEDIDAIIVLGCKVNDDSPSLMLKNRLDMGIDLYKNMDTKLLLSGDHGQVNYDEVNVMRNYVLESDISTDDIFLDHAGFSTYDSMYRAKKVFGIKKIIIVTQEYHLYRSLYIASKLGLDAYGVSALDIPYPLLNKKNNLRELLARNKDFVKVIFSPSSKYVGDSIDIKGNGNVTLD